MPDGIDQPHNSRYWGVSSGTDMASGLSDSRSTWGTSTRLLRQIKGTPGHPRWAVFYRRYAPLILWFARRCGCSYDQTEDILQETMVRLMRALPGFDYDASRGNFRSYVLKIVQNLVYTQRARDKHKRQAELDLKEQDGIECPEMTRAWDYAWKMSLLSMAMEHVKTRVTKVTYESFRLYAIENRSAGEVAELLGIAKNVVYQHRNRMIRLLAEEVEKLQEAE